MIIHAITNGKGITTYLETTRVFYSETHPENKYQYAEKVSIYRVKRGIPSKLWGYYTPTESSRKRIITWLESHNAKAITIDNEYYLEFEIYAEQVDRPMPILS